MFHSRLACVAVALVLGLTAGCSCFSNHHWFGRNRSPDCACPGSGETIVSEGPVLTESAPPPRPVLTQPLTPVPRLIPQPQVQPSPTPAPPRTFVPQ